MNIILAWALENFKLLQRSTRHRCKVNILLFMLGVFNRRYHRIASKTYDGWFQVTWTQLVVAWYETLFRHLPALRNTRRGSVRISGLQSSASRIHNTGYLVSSTVSLEYTTQDIWSPVQCPSNTQDRISSLQSSVSRIYKAGYLVSSTVHLEYTTQISGIRHSVSRIHNTGYLVSSPVSPEYTT